MAGRLKIFNQSTGLWEYSGFPGPKGDTGPAGEAGPAGEGVPAAGTTGQVLAKKSNTDYDTEWKTPTHPVSIPIMFEASQKPDAGATYEFVANFAFSIPSGLTKTKFQNKDNPASEQVISLKKGGVEFGTITVSTGGVPTLASASGAAIAEDDVIAIGPFPDPQDATWAGISINLAGSRS